LDDLGAKTNELCLEKRISKGKALVERRLSFIATKRAFVESSFFEKMPFVSLC
jgi:hypothetical protein